MIHMLARQPHSQVTDNEVLLTHGTIIEVTLLQRGLIEREPRKGRNHIVRCGQRALWSSSLHKSFKDIIESVFRLALQANGCTPSVIT